jgi:hypothetical protein
MIVRDEEELLPRCLEAARTAYDELIVVDTGSRDRTAEIAVSAGARVVTHPWTGDFAEARNVGLAHASGDWILYLDADEIASPELAPQVRAAIEDDGLGAATVQMRNEMPDGHSRVTPLLRLFRWVPGAMFQHRVHEEILSSLRPALERTGRRIGALSAEVLHLGYGRDRAAAKDKKRRDSDLLEACVAADAGDFYSWFKLLELARFWGDADLGARTAARCLRALVQAGPRALAGAPFGGDLLALAATAHAGADPAAAAKIMDAWSPYVLPSAAFSLRRGELAEESCDAARAAREYGRCLDLDGAAADRQLTTVRPLMGLARLSLATGNLEAAWTFVERALAHNGRDPETVAAAVSICHRLGGQALVDQLAATFRARFGNADAVDRALATLHG